MALSHTQKTSLKQVVELHAEAIVLYARDPDAIAMRSCWNCNPAHRHLRSTTDRCIIFCFDCGRYYFKGIDITYDALAAEEEKGAE